MSVARLAASCAAAACASTTAARLAEIPSGCPMHADRQKGAKKPPSGCPMHAAAGGTDARNNMPAVAAQERAPGQESALSTERVESSIPTLDAGSRWTYPSPQMFWNSLVRKGKVGGASEGDMDTVIAVHNSMNEATWAKILEWEALSDPGAAAPPRLARFTGRPTEHSPKAWLKQLFGHPKPFDRHDWIVVRGGGAETMHDVGAVKSILLDVRPALDSPAALWDRVATMPLKRLRGELEPALPFFPSAGMGAPPVDDVQQLNAELVQVANDKIAKKCADNFQRLAACGDDEAACADAAIRLQHCVASVVCPEEAASFQAAAAEDPDKMEAAYEAMDRALDAAPARRRCRRRAEEHAAER
ncbi:holocytochrome-c synthase [Aureococcus anophagefferens]|nr:holocytochrome-c synthase [Aureococcus anophagefferens]